MAEVLKKQRKGNFSPEEVDVLVKTVGKNYETLYGEFSKRAMFRDNRHQAWLDITREVNLVSLEERTLQEVKNKWKKCQHLLYKSDESGILTGPDEIAKSDEANVWELLTSIDEDEDSMPLQQRLQAPTPSTSEQEPVLHSQPLSPTKLKVTRHSKPAQAAPTTAPLLQPPIEEVCLKWNSHHSNMQNSFPSLLLREQYVDATLVAEGQTLKCHRVILSSCSTYFEEVLSSISAYQHPVLFMKDTPFWILKSLCDYMYSGEVHIPQAKLHELLAAAGILKIKGLSEQPVADNPAVKTEPQESIKEEKGDEEDAKRRDDIKKREEKDSRKKEEAKKKEDREVRKKDEVKKKEEVKEVKEKKRSQATPPPDMPVLKSAKLSKVTQHNEMPNLSKNNKSSKVGNSRRSAKKSEKVEIVTKEPSGIFLDPLDLLEPVYEEITKEPLPTSTPKDTKAVPVRRSFPKKLKKRKITDDRDDSPQPVLSRRGTRSRPNRKVPKFYHSNFDNSTIVREPHTDQADPLMQLQEIKSEPIYLEENAIEIEDNLVGFSEQEITIDEEIMGDYDSPIVNFARSKADLEPQTSKSEDTLKIVNVEDIRGATGQKEDMEEDPLHVQNVIENNENCLGFRISEVVTQKEDSRSTDTFKELGFQITNVVSEKEEETATCADIVFRISDVLSGIEEAGPAKETPKGDKNENGCSDTGLQENEEHSIPNQTIVTQLETAKENFECKNRGVSEKKQENTPDLQNLEDTLEKNNEDTLDNHENDSETSTCAGFHNSDMQSALNDDSFRSDVEKMQVDGDTEEIVNAEGGENGDFASPPKEQTENDAEVGEIITNIGEKLPQSSSNTSRQQTTCVTTQFGFNRSPNSVKNPPELRLEATKSNEILEELPDMSKLDFTEFGSRIPECSENPKEPLDSDLNETKFDLTGFGCFSNPERNNSAELRPTELQFRTEEPLNINPNEAEFSLADFDCSSNSVCIENPTAIFPTESAESPDTRPNEAESQLAGFGYQKNPEGIEHSAELKPTDTECFATPEEKFNLTDFGCLNNPESTDNLAELRPALPEFAETLEEPTDIIPAEAEFNLAGFGYHNSEEIEEPKNLEFFEETPNINPEAAESNSTEFDRLTNLTELRPTSRETTGEPTDVCANEAKFNPVECPSVSQTPDDIEPSLQGFSPDEPGFHIARLAIEQIARNEEHRPVGGGSTDCAKSSSSAHNNDLETIVNDLTKIVGGSGSGGEEGEGEVEDSSAIAESLENLLNE